MNSTEVVRRLRNAGWKVDRQTRNYSLVMTKGEKEVSIPHPKADLKTATLKLIEAQTGVKLT